MPISRSYLANTVCALLAPATLAVLCNSCDTATESWRIVAVEVDPAAVALSTGAARALTAALLDESGARHSGPDVHWSVQNPQIASITAQGILTALSPGKTEVAASTAGISGTALVTVSALPPALVRVSPPATSVFVGATTQLVGEVRDTRGEIVVGVPISWTSSNRAVASVDSTGIVTGRLPGSAVIAARAAGLIGTAVVSVRLVP